MRRITKRQEPESLTKYRHWILHQYPDVLPKKAWEEYPGKAEARRQLCEEQKYLCCFCMGPIRSDEHEMRIAHFLPQAPRPADPAPYRGHVLDWLNLFGACRGHQGDSYIEAHCDIRQKNLRLHSRLHPCDYQRGTLKYDAKGTVTSGDDDILRDANEKLGLNIEFLKQERRNALEIFRTTNLPSKMEWNAKLLRKAIDICDGQSSGSAMPYGEVVRQYLERRLASLSR